MMGQGFRSRLKLQRSLRCLNGGNALGIQALKIAKVVLPPVLAMGIAPSPRTHEGSQKFANGFCFLRICQYIRTGINVGGRWQQLTLQWVGYHTHTNLFGQSRDMWFSKGCDIHGTGAQGIIEFSHAQMHQGDILERQARAIQCFDQENLAPRPFHIAHTLATQITQALHAGPGMLNQAIFRSGAGEGRNNGQIDAGSPGLNGRSVPHISHVQRPGTDGFKNSRATCKVGQLQLKADLFTFTACIQQMANQLALVSNDQLGLGVCCRTCSAGGTHGGHCQQCRPRQQKSTLVHYLLPMYAMGQMLGSSR